MTRKLPYLICILFISAVIAIAIYGNAKYEKGIGLKATYQSAYIKGNTLYFSATLNYSANEPVRMSALLNGYGHKFIYYWGLFNQTFLNESVCHYPCSINPNEIMLQPGTHSMKITAIIKNVSEEQYVSLFLYNSNYSYNSPAVAIK